MTALLRDARVLIRGAGELGSGVAVHLAQQGIGRILMVERAFPKAVRRNVCFSEAVFDHAKTIEGVTARFAMMLSEVDLVHRMNNLFLRAGAEHIRNSGGHIQRLDKSLADAPQFEQGLR